MLRVILIGSTMYGDTTAPGSSEILSTGSGKYSLQHQHIRKTGFAISFMSVSVLPSIRGRDPKSAIVEGDVRLEEQQQHVPQSSAPCQLATTSKLVNQSPSSAAHMSEAPQQREHAVLRGASAPSGFTAVIKFERLDDMVFISTSLHFTPKYSILKNQTRPSTAHRPGETG